MNNLNTVLIEGLLTRDPELGNAPAQVQMCRLSLANNRYFRGKEKWEQEASYFTVYVYGKVAGACLTYLKKGRGVRIVGRLKQLTWRTGGLQSEKIIILAEFLCHLFELDDGDTPVEPIVKTFLAHRLRSRTVHYQTKAALEFLYLLLYFFCCHDVVKLCCYSVAYSLE